MIENVSDTALWVAVYRATETLRPDALFHDPLAERLAGSRGAAIARRASGGKMIEWSVVIRTYIIDRFIRQLLEKGVDTVVNLGAGLDTRPYRMNIPSHIRWIEADYPNMVDYKDSRLSSEQPACNLERVRLDLADLPSRRTFLDDLSAASQNILVLTEGVIPYLTPEQVSSLATDLRQRKGIQYWIVDYQSSQLQKYSARSRSRRQTKNAPLQFVVADWFGFFERLQWHTQDIQYLAEVSHQLGRTVPLPWVARIMMSVMKDPAYRKYSAYVVLTPKSLSRALLRPHHVPGMYYLMSRHANAPIQLPPPIAAYFAVDTSDANAVARCFSESAVVIDERREHRGRPSIARWADEATAKYHYTSEPLGVDVSGPAVTVTARVTGDFPGSPVKLQYRFTLEGASIATLEITA
jgi:methyltransferase (TIGR00027 family)